MLSYDQIKRYSTYKTEDFLSDSFFIHSIKEPNEETEIFWSEFIENNPANIDEFLQAKDILLAIKDDEAMMLSDMEVNRLLDNIMEINSAGRDKRNRRPVRYWLGAAAGVAACLAIAIFMFNKSGQLSAPQNDISSYVEKNKTVNFNDTAVKLIISDQKTIVSEESDPSIVYDSDEIRLSSEEISKTESARYNNLIVPYGKRSRLTLSDGTKIWVNAGTSITYPVEFTDNKREVYVSGEIFLDVTHDANRPFIVKTDNFDIQVLGTRFNVSTYQNEVNNVVLASGAVKISGLKSGQQDILLQPSEMFELQNGQSLKKRVNVECYTSWIEGLYLFNNERLDIIMKRLSKYYGKNIECSPNIGQLRCSGKLDLKENLEDILDNLGLISAMKYTSDNNNYRIY